VSGRPFKYASPSNDPAIGIMAVELGIKCESVSKSRLLLTPNLVLTGLQDEHTRLHRTQHSIFRPMTVTPLGFGNHVMALQAHRYTTQRPQRLR
jgi:hypothetical protein